MVAKYEIKNNLKKMLTNENVCDSLIKLSRTTTTKTEKRSFKSLL